MKQNTITAQEALKELEDIVSDTNTALWELIDKYTFNTVGLEELAEHLRNVLYDAEAEVEAD